MQFTVLQLWYASSSLWREQSSSLIMDQIWVPYIASLSHWTSRVASICMFLHVPVYLVFFVLILLGVFKVFCIFNLMPFISFRKSFLQALLMPPFLPPFLLELEFFYCRCFLSYIFHSFVSPLFLIFSFNHIFCLPSLSLLVSAC